MPTTLETLTAVALRQGWASAPASLDEIRREAASLSYVEVPVRRGDSPVTTLRPTDAANARPNSLSARYGKGDWPLHTDGAHLREPPDIVVLACEGTSTTPTRLWRINFSGPEPYYEYARSGVFLVVNGRDSFFSTSLYAGRLRYDPGCMVPGDARARKAADFFDAAAASAEDHAWETPGTVLLIDNRKVLHGRGSAVDDPGRELQRVDFRLSAS